MRFPSTPRREGAYSYRLVSLSRIFDASDPDLSQFAGHGGTLLLIHGTADTIIPTNASMQYYEMVKARMGHAAAEDFMQLYLISGIGHGHGRGRFTAGVDAPSTLDEWIETDQLPERLTVTDNNRSGYAARARYAYTRPGQSTTAQETRSCSFHCALDE